VSRPPTYWLARFLILRLLGFVYGVAFLCAAKQIVPLIGSRGLLPLSLYLGRIQSTFGGWLEGFLQFPSLFWIDSSDAFLLALAWTGVGLSLVVMAGYANALLMALLWAFYMSFVHVGQDWYGYGWEIQLLETGFLGIFLCPLLDGRPFPRRPPPAPVLVLLRWLIFRIMLGAGLIKLRGDPCWRDLTCLEHHYETQPIPNPLSRTLHFMPRWFHKAGVLFNHLAELVAPWFVFGPRLARHVAGAILASFQIFLIFSGNLSFLNHLALVPILACFDDQLLERVLPRRLAARASRARAEAVPSRAQAGLAIGLAITVAALSIYPVGNLLSGRQAMNASFNRLELVNTYGAFGSVGKIRHEIIFEGTSDATLEQARWREYEFVCKPGDPRRRPCVVAPYQPRLDWQIWFAAMSSPVRYPWTLHLIAKLLRSDPSALALLEGNPFPDAPPRYIRAVLYRYRFAPPGNPTGVWWEREPLGIWIPPLSAHDPRLEAFLEAQGWSVQDP
jgi:hypothetical protein